MLVYLRDGSPQTIFTCCHIEIEAADQTFYLTQPQYTDTWPTSLNADPLTPGSWQGSHRVSSFRSLVCWTRKNPHGKARIEARIYRTGGGHLHLGLAVRGSNTECTDTGCPGTIYRYGSKCTGIPEPTQGAELSLSLSLSHTHAHACTCTHTHARTRTHTHTLCRHFPLPPSPVGRIFFPPSTYTSPLLPTFPQSLSIAPANMPLAAQQGTL